MLNQIRNKIFYIVFLISSIGLLWHSLITIFSLPPYILPEPLLVLKKLWITHSLLTQHFFTTFAETLLGLLFGAIIGVVFAMSITLFKPLGRWLIPIILLSQAIPIFAIAPLLVLWFGYGMWSKVITTTLMLFFPIASAFLDGLRRTNQQWLELGTVMGASKYTLFRFICIPAAMPALVSGLRVATAIAPLGAVVGEWVGSSRGLGFLLLNANAQVQVELLFATLLVLIVMTLILYTAMNYLFKKLIPWQTETS